jgi:RHS repeat-associated protein
VQTGFVYDGINFVQELSGATPKANLITGGVDELLLRRESAGTRHPIADALGSLIALTDATGALSTLYSFEPYGKAISGGAADTNSQSNTGREDDGTGLFYYRARYYAVGPGRFVAEDPIGIRGGPMHMSMYVEIRFHSRILAASFPRAPPVRYRARPESNGAHSSLDGHSILHAPTIAPAAHG